MNKGWARGRAGCELGGGRGWAGGGERGTDEIVFNAISPVRDTLAAYQGSLFVLLW